MRQLRLWRAGPRYGLTWTHNRSRLRNGCLRWRHNEADGPLDLRLLDRAARRGFCVVVLDMDEGGVERYGELPRLRGKIIRRELAATPGM